jgi:hypothetical protein
MTDVVNQNKTKDIFAYNTSLPPSPPNRDAILDSGTTGNYLTVDRPVTNLTPTPNGVRAKIPDGKAFRQPTNVSYASQLSRPKPELATYSRNSTTLSYPSRYCATMAAK